MKIQNCYNIGSVSSQNYPEGTGACVGAIGNIYLTKCYSSIALNLRGNTGGGTNTNCAGRLGEALKGYASTLGAGYKNDKNPAINGGYPILVWQ